jgi:hypothetical protein
MNLGLVLMKTGSENWNEKGEGTGRIPKFKLKLRQNIRISIS